MGRRPGPARPRRPGPPARTSRPGPRPLREALPILEEIGARLEIARCLAGLGRVALDLGAAGQAHRYLARSIKLSQATGTRVGVARGLEAFAALAVRENQPERAVQLAAAAAALRESAGVPPLPPSRTDTYLAPARHLGEAAIARLWAQGQALSSEAAVALATDTQPSKAAADSEGRALTLAEPEATSPSPAPDGTGPVLAAAPAGRDDRAGPDRLEYPPPILADPAAGCGCCPAAAARPGSASWRITACGRPRTRPSPAAGSGLPDRAATAEAGPPRAGTKSNPSKKRATAALSRIVATGPLIRWFTRRVISAICRHAAIEGSSRW